MLTINDIAKAASVVAVEFEIKKVILFGSYAEGSNTPDSDVDLLVEFHADAVSLLTLVSLKNRIEELLCVDVDVIHAPLEDESLIQINKAVEIYAA